LPRSAVKGANIIPDRERFENAVILSLHKYASGIGFDFDGADCAPSEEFSTEDTPAASCEECEFS
jgi:hypothetical protein